MRAEKQLLVDLTNAGVPYSYEQSSAPVFGRLQNMFPVGGSKIAWSRVPGSAVETADTSDGDSYLSAAESFFDRNLAGHGLSDEVEILVVGDSAMDGAVRMSLSSLRSCLGIVLGMPQHTYVLPQDAEWCFVFTMEGDLCFGYSPSSQAASES